MCLRSRASERVYTRAHKRTCQCTFPGSVNSPLGRVAHAASKILNQVHVLNPSIVHVPFNVMKRDLEKIANQVCGEMCKHRACIL